MLYYLDMFDFIPWMDEIQIVEMGRLILSGGSADTILASRDGVPFIPLYYLGPCLQELLCRTFGMIGVRLSPLVALGATAFFFNRWLRKAHNLKKSTVVMLTLIALTAPLLVQSVRQVRVDNWVFACVFATLSILGRSDVPARKSRTLVAAGAIAAVSVFIWPSAVMPALLYPTLCFSLKRKGEFIRFVIGGLIATALLILPVIGQLPDMLSAFGFYADANCPKSFSLANALIPFVKETLRSPFLMPLSLLGFAVWAATRRFARIAAFALSLIIGIYSGLHTFRFIFLMPFFLIMAIDAAAWLERKSCRYALVILTLTAFYGIVTGPVAYLLIPHEIITRSTESSLVAAVGHGNQRVLTPDYATYYIGRRNGWRQFALANQADYGNLDSIRKLLDKADVVVIQRHDPFRAIEETHTLYGLLRDHALNVARAEQKVENKSFLGKIGAQFAGSGHPVFRSPEHFTPMSSVGDFTVFKKDVSCHCAWGH